MSDREVIARWLLSLTREQMLAWCIGHLMAQGASDELVARAIAGPR